MTPPIIGQYFAVCYGGGNCHLRYTCARYVHRHTSGAYIGRHDRFCGPSFFGYIQVTQCAS